MRNPKGIEWRPRPELNWCKRFCRPLRNHSATWPHRGNYLKNQRVAPDFSVLAFPRQAHETRPKTVLVPTKVPTAGVIRSAGAQAIIWARRAGQSSGGALLADSNSRTLASPVESRAEPMERKR